MKGFIAAASISCGMVLAGCTTTGTGYGDVQAGGSGPVSFSWKSTDGGISGTMSASISHQQSFSGQFFQITTDTHIEGLGPLWYGWRYGWSDWGPGSANGFVTYYSGRVLANLDDANGKHMRCRFSLADPYAGMQGGGSGDCQIAGGEKISATFPRA